uniref:Cytochrome b5 heme-binding domain-containing protein n=1 Tax=Kalanchoe fedtschenkoi TaxID=63787 RepID=A0A7N0TZ48_KALFE
MAPASKVHTFDDVSRHDQLNDCWLIIAGKVYDVTSFMEEHPGGDQILLSAAAKDATEDFEDIGHSDAAREQMETFCVGTIDRSTIPKNRSRVPPKHMNYNKVKATDFVAQILLLLVPLMILGLASFPR